MPDVLRSGVQERLARRAPRAVLAAWLACAFASALLAPAAAADSILVDFEGAGSGCGFAGTAPLRSLPGHPDLAFGPAGMGNDAGGGAVLGSCAGFGVTARSGESFLAFNRGGSYEDEGDAGGPEAVHFDGGASRVSVWASGGRHETSFRIEAFAQDGSLLASREALAAAGEWVRLELEAAGIQWVQLSEIGGDNSYVFDDLSYDTLPEPGTALLLLVGLAAAARRRPARRLARAAEARGACAAS